MRNRVAGGPTWYNVPAEQVGFEMYKVVGDGLVKFEDLYFSGMAPTAKTLIQGELMRDERGLYFNYSRVAKPMRDALREQSLHASGIMVPSLLRQFMCPNSYDWLQVLLDRYPDHVIEISVYDEQWGTLAPLFNTCFWEVRQY